MNPWLLAIYASYGIPSIVLYALVIFVIVTRPKVFEGPYYALYLFVLIGNVLTYFNTYFTIRLRDIPGIAEGYVGLEDRFWPYRIAFNFQYTAFHIQNVSLILLHFNRVTAVFLPLYHQKFWRKAVVYVIMFSIVYSFGITAHTFFAENIYVLVDNRTIELTPDVYNQLSTDYSILSICGPIYLGISIGGTTLTILKLAYLRKINQTQSARREISLFLISFCSVLSQIASQFIIQRITSLARQALDPEHSTFWTAVNSDGFSLPEVYIAIAMNPLIRREIIALVYKNLATSSIIDISSGQRNPV